MSHSECLGGTAQAAKLVLLLRWLLRQLLVSVLPTTMMMMMLAPMSVLAVQCTWRTQQGAVGSRQLLQPVLQLPAAGELVRASAYRLGVAVVPQKLLLMLLLLRLMMLLWCCDYWWCHVWMP